MTQLDYLESRILSRIEIELTRAPGKKISRIEERKHVLGNKNYRVSKVSLSCLEINIIM